MTAVPIQTGQTGGLLTPQPTWQQRFGLTSPTGNIFGSPMFNFGIGLLSRNRGQSKGQAFSNAMGGGLLGLREARRAEELQSMQQYRAAQQQAVMQGMAAQKAKQERKQKWQNAMMVPGTGPVQMGPPDPSGQMQTQPGMPPRLPETAEEGMQGALRGMAYDPTASASIANALGMAQQMGLTVKPNPHDFKKTQAVNNALAMGMEIGSPEFNKYVRDVTMKSGTEIIFGGQGGMPQLLTPEQKNQFGYREDETPYVTPKGEIKNPPRDPGEKYKMRSFVQNMETSLSGIKNRFLDDQGFMKPDIDYRGIAGSMNALQLKLASGQGVMSSLAQSTMSADDKKLTADFLEFIAGSRGYSSGAAVPEIEVARDMAIYAPQPNDSDDVIAYRLKKMEDRVENVKGIKDPKRRRKVAEDIAKADEIEIKKFQDKSGPVANPTTLKEYNALPSGALFVDPDDGTVLRKP